MDSHNEGPSDINGSNREENSDEEGEIKNIDKKQNYSNITWTSVVQPLQDINFSKELILHETKRFKHQNLEFKILLPKNINCKKLMGRTIALELVNWADQHEKGIAAKILVMDAMSSKESCYRDNDSGDSSRVKKYSFRRLEWESWRMKALTRLTRKANN
ncbi:hypothetical protein pdam_00020923, partial [Pocillopora damicornis]